MKALRVLMLVHEFPKRSEAFLVDKFIGLVRAGVDVQLVAERARLEDLAAFPELAAEPALLARLHLWTPRERTPALLFEMAKTLLAAALRRPRTLGALWRVLADQPLRERPGRLAYALRVVDLEPDVVHVEFGTLAAERPELFELGLPCVVVSYRGWDVNYHALDRPERIRRVFERADAFHFLGADLLERARRRGLPAHARHALIPPAVDPARFDAARRRPDPSAPLRIVSVGRLHWKKGYEYALQALGAVRDAGVAFDYRIVGEGPFREAIETCIRELGLESHVSLLGPLDRKGVVDELAAADLMLHAAVSEGFCNAVLEAQAMGVPVVTSDADGLRENVGDGETGCVVPRRDPQAMGRTILELARDAEARRALGARGPERVRTAFAPRDQIAAFIEFYRATRSNDARAPARPESPAS